MFKDFKKAMIEMADMDSVLGALMITGALIFMWIIGYAGGLN